MKEGLTLFILTIVFACLIFGSGYYLASCLINWFLLPPLIYLPMFLYDCVLFYYSKTYLVAKSKAMTYFIGISCFYYLFLILFSIPCHFLPIDPISKGSLCFILTTLLALHAYKRCQTLSIRKYSLPFLKKDTKIILLSDLHIGYYVGVSFIKNMVDRINAQHPDYVLIAGDLINCRNTKECEQIDEVALILSTIHAPKGCYAITGNHDPFYEDEDFVTFLKKAQITLLDDSSITDEELQIIGRRTRTEQRKDIQSFTKSDKPCIILDHDPLCIDDAISFGADAIFCGHTHKGQLFPFTLLVKAIYHHKRDYGYHKEQNTHCIISAGTGYFSMPFRTGSTGEIIVLTK